MVFLLFAFRILNTERYLRFICIVIMMDYQSSTRFKIIIDYRSARMCVFVCMLGVTYALVICTDWNTCRGAM